MPKIKRIKKNNKREDSVEILHDLAIFYEKLNKIESKIDAIGSIVYEKLVIKENKKHKKVGRETRKESKREQKEEEGLPTLGDD